MKPAWDQLGAEFEGSNVLIADVDCTSDESRDLCSEYGVSGYPTIKYSNMDTEGDKGESYNGGRDFDALKKFVEDKLAKFCDVNDPVDCSEKEANYITKMKEKGDEAIAKQLKRLSGMKDGKMKPELKKWMSQRLAILEQLSA